MSADQINKHIVWVIMDFYPTYTGHGIYLQKLSNVFSDMGYSFTVVTARNSEAEKRIEQLGNIRIKRIPCKLFSSNSNNFLLFSIKACFYLFFIRNRYKVIHLHGFFDRFGLFCWLAKLMDKKIIMQMVLFGCDDPDSCLRSYKFRNVRVVIFKMFDLFITISTLLTQECLKFNIPKNKIVQIPQGVMLDKFYPVPMQEKYLLKNKNGFSKQEKIACFIGAIIHRKGVDLLCNAWKILKQKGYKDKLLLVGPYSFNDVKNNQYVDFIRSFIKDNDLNIELVGETTAVVKYLQLSDLFVFPSRWEGFGNVIIEAMACGLPVVISHMQGIAYDIVSDGIDGYIVDIDPMEIADKIEVLFNDDMLCKKMGNAARKKAEQKFDMRVIVNKYADVYENIAAIK